MGQLGSHQGEQGSASVWREAGTREKNLFLFLLQTLCWWLAIASVFSSKRGH